MEGPKTLVAKMPQAFKNSEERKLQLVKDVLAEPKSSYLSDYDIVQRFLFMVELTRGEKLAKVACDYPEFKNVKLENIPIEEIAEYAIQAFLEIIPIDELLEYRELLHHSIIKKMMSHYPDLIKEFDNILKQKYVLRNLKVDVEN